MNEVYAKYIKWINYSYYKPKFLILWSDDTYSTIEFENGKKHAILDDLRPFFKLNIVISKRMKKEEAMNYINNKLQELQTMEEPIY